MRKKKLGLQVLLLVRVLYLYGYKIYTIRICLLYPYKYGYSIAMIDNLCEKREVFVISLETETTNRQLRSPFCGGPRLKAGSVFQKGGV
jgi:hypothetical protein